VSKFGYNDYENPKKIERGKQLLKKGNLWRKNFIFLSKINKREQVFSHEWSQFIQLAWL
jgi:hypothetical protein